MKSKQQMIEDHSMQTSNCVLTKRIVSAEWTNNDVESIKPVLILHEKQIDSIDECAFDAFTNVYELGLNLWIFIGLNICCPIRSKSWLI